jgi:hypothetical protein
MPINSSQDERSGAISVGIYGPIVGIDTKSGLVLGESGTSVLPEHFESLQNMNLKNGIPVRMNGSTLFATGFVMPDGDHPVLLAQYLPSTTPTLTANYIAIGQNGIAYRVVVSGGTATFTQIRAGLTPNLSEKFWSHLQLENYLIACNRVDGHFKWDGHNFIPLGAKMISDMEPDETWTNGTAVTTAGQFREGTQGQSRQSTGTPVTITRTITDTNFLTGLLLADNYDTTGPSVARIHFFLYVPTAANVDTTNTFLRFGNAADTAYFQAAASLWGPLTNGLNEISIGLDKFVATGAPVWTDIDKITFSFDTTGATMTFVVDDLYIRYSASETMPAAQVSAELKNIYMAGDGTTDRSNLYFAKANAPDQFDPLAFLSIKANDGSNITGAKKYYNQVFLTKETSCHSLSVDIAGTIYPNYRWDRIEITTQHGCTSHRGIVEYDRQLYLPWRNQIWVYNGTGTEKISDIVDPTLSDINYTRLTQVVGAPYNKLNQIWWAYPGTGDTDNDNCIVYQTDTKGFLDRAGQSMNWLLNIFVSGEEILLSAGPTGRVLQQDLGATFDGADINFVVRPQFVSGEAQDMVKCWIEGMVEYARVANGGNFTVDYRIADHPSQFNTASWVTAATIDMGTAGDQSFGRFFIGEPSVWIQVRITGTTPLALLWPLKVKGTPQYRLY